MEDPEFLEEEDELEEEDAELEPWDEDELEPWEKDEPLPPAPPEDPRPYWQRARQSGRLSLRMPASLHDRLTIAAAAERTSLNQFICTVLAATVEWRKVSREERRDARKRLRGPAFYERLG